MKKIGRYIIQGLLGRGGMGKIYKVQLPTIRKIAALKILYPNPLLTKLMGIDNLHNLFMHEAVTMANIDHPNIVTVHDFDNHEGRPFFVMDFFANNLGSMMGETFAVEKPSRRIVIEKALAYTLQTLDGLGCLHDAGILHRDIKPFNLLVTAQDSVKICDFGLSKMRNEEFKGPPNLNVGTPYYAAPEQEETPDIVDARADLYPVGIMLYRMLTSRLPYLSGMDRKYIPPSRLNQHLNSDWDHFISKAIARRPSHRYTDAKAMRSALTDLWSQWVQWKEKNCRLPKAIIDPPPQASRPTTRLPRQTPVKLRPSEGARRFKLNTLWQPLFYTNNQFNRTNDAILVDDATGLIWQKSGSTYPRRWQDAHLYTKKLNKEAFSGIRNWRLPTIDELVTLLNPNPQGAQLCIESVFDRTQRWIWSSDRRSFISAYYLDYELGFVGWQDFSAPYYVKAVSCASVR